MTNTIAIFGLLVVLMAIGMPVGVALGLTVLSFMFIFTDVPLESVALKMFTGIEKFEIMAIPFFILAGNFLTHGGVARRMINFATAMVGHLRGGLGMSAVLACALFAAVSGSSPATVVAIGSILIPPSIVMVMYSVTTNSSVGALFMAGVIPGLLLAFMLGLCTWYVARKNNYPTLPRTSWGDRIKHFRKAFWGLMLIVVVMGGIYSGMFTPTEAAAMSAVYAFFIAVFVYKDLSFKQIPRVLLDSANMSAMLLFIIASAVLFSFILTSEQIPQRMADAIVASGMGPIGFLIVVNLLLLVAGALMEPSSIILILAPILFPVAVALGIDPIHFGVMIVVNMEIGMITPPVGLNLFVASGITKAGLTEMSKAVMPWLYTMLVFLMMITYIPSISTFLPRALGMM